MSCYISFLFTPMLPHENVKNLGPIPYSRIQSNSEAKYSFMELKCQSLVPSTGLYHAITMTIRAAFFVLLQRNVCNLNILQTVEEVIT